MRMLLFAVVLNPLICLLVPHLRGVRIGHRKKKTAAMAYADDVMIFVTSSADF
jgi:hypothetical protein